ncbi:MAG: hypothetical protein Q9209_003600 [Squamulea sp. 1 TL-2023]
MNTIVDSVLRFFLASFSCRTTSGARVTAIVGSVIASSAARKHKHNIFDRPSTLHSIVVSNANETFQPDRLSNSTLPTKELMVPDNSLSRLWTMLLTPVASLGTLPEPATDDRNSSGLPSPGLLTPSSHDSDTYSGFMGSCLTPLDLSADYFVSSTAHTLANKAGKVLCPLCPASSRGFRTMQALGNHLASPAHAPKIFHCPVDLVGSEKKGKQPEALIKEFSTLSGLTQHVESGACEGGRKKLEGAMGFVQERLKELGFKDVRLLK